MQRYVSKMKAPAMEALEQAQKLGATAAKFSYIHNASHDVSFESGRLKTCSGEETQDYSITVVVNHRWGSARGNILSAIPQLVERAIALAKNGAVSHFDEYPAPAESYREIRSYSPSVNILTSEKMVNDCQGFVDRLLAADSSLIVDAGGSVGEIEALRLRARLSWPFHLASTKRITPLAGPLVVASKRPLARTCSSQGRDAGGASLTLYMTLMPFTMM